MKNLITKLVYILMSISCIFAQEKKMTTSISIALNAGTSSSEGVNKDYSLNPNLGFDLTWKNFGFGLDLGRFSTKTDFDTNNYVQQNNAILKNATSPTNQTTATSTYFLLGPHYAFNKGKVTAILATRAGITLNKMAAYSLVDQATGVVYANYQAPDDFVKNAFTLRPSLTIKYALTKSLAVSANAQFIKQLGQESFGSTYKDLSMVKTTTSDGIPLKPDQIFANIQKAPTVTTTTKGASEYLSFGLGIVYNFSIRKGWDGTVKGKTEEPTTDATTKKGWDGTVKGKTEAPTTDATTKKGWDGTVKGKTEEPTTDATTKKGWDGTVKGKTEEPTTDATTQKGWDGTVKGKTEEPTTDATTKKGWDGTVKGKTESPMTSKSSIKTKGTGAILNRATKPDGSNDSSPIPVKNSKKGYDHYQAKSDIIGEQATQNDNDKGSRQSVGKIFVPKSENSIRTKGTGATLNRTTKPESTKDTLAGQTTGKIVVPKSENAIKTKGTGASFNRTTKPDGSNDSSPIPVKKPNQSNQKTKQTSNVLKTKHDTAKNSISNVR